MATETPTLVLLVRHGLTPETGKVLYGRTPGVHLSDAGRAQAEHVAGRLAGLAPVAAVYVSPLERTMETAEPIALALGRDRSEAEGLVECDFGDWTGRKLSALRRLKAWEQVQRSPSRFRFPSGESFLDMQHRMVTTVETLAARHRGKRIVCVSHADPIRALVAHLSGAHIDQFQRWVVSPCSVTAALVGGGSPVLLGVNTLDGDLSRLGVS